jgi:hypothetical protein
MQHGSEKDCADCLFVGMQRMANYKVPKTVIFSELPKTVSASMCVCVCVYVCVCWSDDDHTFQHLGLQRMHVWQ